MASSHSRPSASYSPTRSSIRKTSSFYGATMSVRVSIGFTGSTTNVRAFFVACCLALTDRSCACPCVSFNRAVNLDVQASAGITSSYGKRSRIASIACPSQPSLMKRSSQCMAASRPICSQWNKYGESCDQPTCPTLVRFPSSRLLRARLPLLESRAN